MDYDFWLKFYKNWEVEQLVSEIDTCHLYQQNQVRLALSNQKNQLAHIQQIIQSQERVTIIVQAIMEKLKND